LKNAKCKLQIVKWLRGGGCAQGLRGRERGLGITGGHVLKASGRIVKELVGVAVVLPLQESKKPRGGSATAAHGHQVKPTKAQTAFSTGAGREH
jgi:hypothetical protein